jgi:putative phage-type endonuclease
MQVIDTSGMTRAEWLALRRKSIGASDAPVIAGLSKYKSRFGLWLEKTQQDQAADEQSEEAWFGTELEGVIEDRLHIAHNMDVVTNRRQVMVRDPRHEWMTATIDAVTKSGDIWEFKASGIATAKGLEDGDASTLPATWQIQAHHQMFITGKPVCHFAVFIGHALKLFTFQVEFDLDLWGPVFELEREFWEHVQSREPPTEFDPADAALLLRHFKGQQEATIVLSDTEDEAALFRFRSCEKAIKEAQADRDRAKAELLARMGNYTHAMCGMFSLRRELVNVKERTQTIKASSYIRFTISGDDE